MGQLDKEILKQLSINQAELARLIGTSRQAVNAGIKKDDQYLDANRLQMIHEAFVGRGDFRQSITAKILQEKFGVVTDNTAGVSDVLGLKLDKKLVSLIVSNQSLREYLKDAVSGLIETKVQEFKALFASKKKPE